MHSKLNIQHSKLKTALALLLGALLVYTSTLTQVHTFDALSYVTSVERKPWTELFHPHHLAYGPLGALALGLGRAAGYTGGAALPLQLVNVAAGALGVALFFASARRVTGRADLALVAALLLGGSYAYWYYAVEVEVYTVAALLLIVCLDILARLAQHPSRRLFLALGFAQGGAVLFHQTNLLLCAAVLALLICARRARGQPATGMRSAATVYGLALGLAVGVPYLLVGIVVSGFRDASAFAAWLTEYARTGWWGGPIGAEKWASLGEGLAATLAQPGGELLGLLLLGLLVLRLRRLAAGPTPLLAALIAWLLVYGAFFLWWEPDNVEFWIASLPPALLLLALALRAARPWGPEVWVGLAVAISAAGVNHDSIARRGNPATDLQRVIARALGAQMQPADLALIPDGLLELYLPYYERHDNFLSLNQALFDAGGDWGRACVAIHARMEAALHAGATAIVADEALRPPDLLLQRHRLDQAAVDACFALYQPDLLPLAMPPQAPYWRLPTAQERADGPGWRFERSAQGWQASNVAHERFAGGWTFVPETDPALLSPLLQLDAGRYEAFELRVVNGTRARDAQLFWAGPDGQLDEERSVRWELEAGAATYRIPLAGRPGWQGVIARLRIDPVGVGDGGELRVEWVRLTRHPSGPGLSSQAAWSTPQLHKDSVAFRAQSGDQFVERGDE